MKVRLPKGILRETLKMAVDSVRGHKFRSFLTVLGIVIGVMTAICIASITMTITIGYIILALGVSSIVGMIAGIYPAFKAARLDPILALTKA